MLAKLYCLEGGYWDGERGCDFHDNKSSCRFQKTFLERETKGEVKQSKTMELGEHISGRSNFTNSWQEVAKAKFINK